MCFSWSDLMALHVVTTECDNGTYVNTSLNNQLSRGIARECVLLIQNIMIIK